MLRPQQNNYRNLIDLSGIWKFKVDPDNKGESLGWIDGFETDLDVAVPGSWNEQLQEENLFNYIGIAWYNKKVFVPKYFSERVWIRLDSVDYNCKIWINGNFKKENIGGFLPIDLEITDYIKAGESFNLVVKVDNNLDSTTIPQGISTQQYHDELRPRDETYPPARFDFFPYGGIQRPVNLYTTPENYLLDYSIKTKIDKTNATLIIEGECEVESDLELFLEIFNGDKIIKSYKKNFKKKFQADVELNDITLWDLENPFLYDLQISIKKDSQIIDLYKNHFGIREVEVKDNKILLNNKPVFLKGFGKHEDFPVIGKGLMNSLLIKDFTLMKWMNTNSFRTSHYPYAEDILDMADRKGFLVIDEVPAVSHDLRRVDETTMKNHRDFVTKLIDRDKNHPSVIMWAPGNEPNILGDKGYYDGSGDAYWKEITDLIRSLDDRPITIPNCQKGGIDDPVFKYSDVLSINRYYGWYENPGQLDIAKQRLENDLDTLNKKYNKPVMVTEFGADTVAGMHSTTDQQFTEEYQCNLIKAYCDVIESKDYTVGEHVWNFADFRTPQHCKRVVNNLKGVLTRTREPKMAAHELKARWGKLK